MEEEERLGWAIVGLGDFAINQVLLRLARTRHCRATALVSGDRAKALTIARAYGINERSVHSYEDFDRIRDDLGVDVAYIVLPNALHAE